MRPGTATAASECGLGACVVLTSPCSRSIRLVAVRYCWMCWAKNSWPTQIAALCIAMMLAASGHLQAGTMSSSIVLDLSASGPSFFESLSGGTELDEHAIVASAGAVTSGGAYASDGDLGIAVTAWSSGMTAAAQRARSLLQLSGRNSSHRPCNQSLRSPRRDEPYRCNSLACQLNRTIVFARRASCR